MTTVSRHLRDLTEFIDSAVRYGLLPAPTSASVTSWGDIDMQVEPDAIEAWAAYCDDAEIAPNDKGTLDQFRFTDDAGFKVHVYSGRRVQVAAVAP